MVSSPIAVGWPGKGARLGGAVAEVQHAGLRSCGENPPVKLLGITGQTVTGKALRLVLRLAPKTAQVRIMTGPLRGMRWIVGAADHGCWIGTYERRQRRVFERVVTPGSVVYDIGAHAGYYTLLGSKLGGPAGLVIAFEPLPRNLRFLREHIRLNGLTNVRVVEGAIADRSGQAMFSEAPSSSMGRLDIQGNVQVRIMSIDEATSQGMFPPPMVMKIDVEGAEGSVLAGAAQTLAQARPAILLSLHGEKARTQCRELLDGLGYELRPLDGRSMDETNEVLATHRRRAG